MRKELFIVLALSLLIVPYQNCSNPIDFTNSELSKAEDQAVDEFDIPNHLPGMPPVEDLVDNPEENDENEGREDEYVELPSGLPDPVVPIGQCGKYYDVIVHEAAGKPISIGKIKAFKNKEMSAIDNYGYKSFSAHPMIGPKIRSTSSKVFLLESSEGLNLNIIFNEDNGIKRSNHIVWHLEVEDNKLRDSVIFMDDPNHSADKILRHKTNSSTKYNIKFGYYMNTDGAIFGPLGNSAKLHINPSLSGLAGPGSYIVGPDSKVLIPNRNKKGELVKFSLVPATDMNCTQ